MGKIKDKVFGLVVSKNVTDSLADSIKDNNQAKFYLAQDKLPNGQALDDVTSPNELTDRNVLIINGNKIQGVNQNDLSKLDSITDVGKLFKYKGSVATGGELLKKVPPEAEVGDVWNVEQECEIDGVKYPAHTNFVCSSAKASIAGKPASSTWDSLGGTMQMGTEVSPAGDPSGTINYKSPTKVPINSFGIRLGTDTGIVTNGSGIISLDLSTALSEKFNNNTLKFSSGSRPVKCFQIDVDTTHGIYITEDKKIGLKVTNAATTTGGAFGDSLLQIGDGLTPIAAFNIKTGNGLRIETQNDNEIGLNISTNGLSINNNKQLYLSLSNDSNASIYDSQYAYCKGSGLCIDSNGGLRIAVATHYNSNGGDIIEGGIVIGSGYNDSEGMKYHGGLCISSKAIAQFVMKNASIAGYINSLIDAKLKAQ